MPLFVVLVGGLIAWRAGDHAGEAVAEAIERAAPYALAAGGAFLIWKGLRRG